MHSHYDNMNSGNQALSPPSPWVTLDHPLEDRGNYYPVIFKRVMMDY